jgi:hypothetical protein
MPSKTSRTPRTEGPERQHAFESRASILRPHAFVEPKDGRLCAFPLCGMAAINPIHGRPESMWRA